MKTAGCSCTPSIGQNFPSGFSDTFFKGIDLKILNVLIPTTAKIYQCVSRVWNGPYNLK